MLKKIIILALVFLNGILLVNAQKAPASRAGQMNPAFQRVLLGLSTTYFTVVKENQVDLDSSLIHVSHSLAISRLPIVADGIDDNNVLKNAQWVDQRMPGIGLKQLTTALGQNRAALLVLIGAYFAFEPGNNTNVDNNSRNYLEAGIKQCDQLNNTKLKLVAQRLLAKLYLKNYDFINADKLFSAVLQGFLNSNDQLEAATTCSWWGLYAPVSSTNTPIRIKHIEMAIQLFKFIDNKEEQISPLINDCYLHVLVGDLNNSLALAKQALNITQIVRFPYSHYVTEALSAVCAFQGKFGEPLNYDIESVQQAEKLRDSIGLPYFYGNLGGLYSTESNAEETANVWYEKSTQVFLSQHEPSYATFLNLTANLLQLGRKDEALALLKKTIRLLPPVTLQDKIYYYLLMDYYYTFFKKMDIAYTYLNKADSVEKELENNGTAVRKIVNDYNFAEFYFEEGNYKKAKSYYEQYLNQPGVTTGTISRQMGSRWALIQIDSILGDKNALLTDYPKYLDVLNRSFNISKSKLAEELQVKYATAKKTDQINELNQKARLEQDNLKKVNEVKDVTIGGIILLMIMAGLLYRQNRIKQHNSDIIKRKNELMQLLLEEKEWLVKEIHHRVKNNLHTIICLLESQAIYLQNDALKAVENSQRRIYAMSLMHQKLYQSDDLKVMDINIYLTEFIQYLKDSFGSPEHIRIILDIEEIKLGAVQAIPVGLIVNEAVNNCFKYAFPNKKRGEIKIELKRIGSDVYLTVADNGVGMKHDLSKRLDSLGLELIKGLALDLRGTVDFEVNNGTSIKLQFKIEPVAAILQESVREQV